MSYQEKLNHIENLTFESIIELNKSLVPSQYRSNPWYYPGLDHGTAVLKTEEQCYAYISAYGEMHRAKIYEVLGKINSNDFKNTDLQIIDWGCGQGLATVCLFDYFKQNNISLDLVKKIVLIEPSTIALNKAKSHVNAYLKDDNRTIAVEKYLDDVTVEEIVSFQPLTIHLFSNILDITSIDLLQLSNKIKKNLEGLQYFFCWGPLNRGNDRIDSFWGYFSEANSVFSNFHNKLEFNDEGRLVNTYNYTAKNRVFKINGNECELIFIDYYLPKQFHASYQLDAVKKALQQVDKDKLEGLYKSLSDFEIQAPFDIGASIHEDVHPILAVLNNIVTRGLPTKASPNLEKSFEDFGNHLLKDDLGGLTYEINDLCVDNLLLAMHIIDSRWQVTRDNYNTNVLDSDLEKTFITEKANPILRQLLQPQRTLASICLKSEYYSQRVDFAFDFPYATKDANGNDFHGCVIELDGNRYHTQPNQEILDRQRNRVLRSANWYCFRLNEQEIDMPYEAYHHLGSEYVYRCEEAYRKPFDNSWVNTLQLVLSPIAVARLEKTILEALMAGVLDIKANTWKVLVKEHDVPCAALAFEELREMFEHITALSVDYTEVHFPKIELTIVSTKEFSTSKLHLNHQVLVDEYHSNEKYDLVIDIAILRRNGLERTDFSEYRCKNNCYFQVRSSHYHRNDRQIYTSDRILYKPITVPNDKGKYDDIEENVIHLKYYLQMLFRKQNFRQGQTSILNRVLQYKSVIGLLPTGGGKSLTYQLAALLQPGITLVIDPLRSLMKDQYDGLISTGIDCCSYINSSFEVPEVIKLQGDEAMIRYRIEERERRCKRLEQSEFLFMFISPERLSIMDFRERLKNMQETGVYFSYGVIDEVHCVSEWGHDFRFSYLHLGKNLYDYVLPKPKEDNSIEDNKKENHIPLFGLTATASFDVLADVERELSGNGAFPLDADTIIREGDTNRVEIQYKIESVPVTFSSGRDGIVKLNKWDVYNSKKDYLDTLISKMPIYLIELLTPESIHVIYDGYTEPKPRADGRQLKPLEKTIPADFLASQDNYDYGAIVFCPYKDSTGVSVFVNYAVLREKHPDTRIGTFVGSSNNDDNHVEDDNTHRLDEREEDSIKNLELFRDNLIPLMIATKAFGMGIDKPNVRFTINMNLSSSLEGFVQEAGRAGRDQKMALSIIMFSKYRIARVKPGSPYYNNNNRHIWYDANDIEALAQKTEIPIDDFDICDESSDIVKLKCKRCDSSCKRFEKGWCFYGCNECNKPHEDHNYKDRCGHRCEYADYCELAKIAREDRLNRYNHLSFYKEKYPFITSEDYEFLNADYETVMYFYNNNFKGEYHEKHIMHQLLSTDEMEVVVDGGQSTESATVNGFLTTLQSISEGMEVVSFISYRNAVYADLAKAIYRMCCIDLIDDFTQDFNNKLFRIVSIKKADGKYYDALEKYLRRYYTAERAADIIKEVPTYKGDNEIHKCLGFLTHFIYEKIAIKRKRAIDDMFAFCIHGTEENKDWKEINEDLKDELYFYFNSKYARHGYTTIIGKPYSLIDDTEEGKNAVWVHVIKYMNVVDNKWITNNSEAGSTQIDNAKHLYGAVRLIRRSVTDTNPTIDLLGAFCLMFLGTNNNAVLQEQLDSLYRSGMKEFHKRIDRITFWRFYNKYNSNPYVSTYLANKGKTLKLSTLLEINKEELSTIKKIYTE